MKFLALVLVMSSAFSYELLGLKSGHEAAELYQKMNVSKNEVCNSKEIIDQKFLQVLQTEGALEVPIIQRYKVTHKNEISRRVLDTEESLRLAENGEHILTRCVKEEYLLLSPGTDSVDLDKVEFERIECKDFIKNKLDTIAPMVNCDK